MKKRIDVNKVRLGMFISEIECSWLASPFPSHRFKVRSDKQIEKLKQYSAFVTIDTRKGLDIKDEPAGCVQQKALSESETERTTEAGKAVRADIAEARVASDRDRASALHKRSYSVLSNVMQDVRLGRSLDTGSVQKVVHELTESVIADRNALLYLSQLQNKGSDLAQKSVNVCILTLVFAKHIGIPRKKIFALGTGALLHDLGMLQVPTDILQKPQKLTLGELALVRKHPEWGRDILSASGGIPDEVLEIVLQHQECVDGSGYPGGLEGRDIGLFARMLAITSVYEALTRERCYEKAMPPTAALQFLYNNRGRYFDARLVEKFIQALGVYPPGCLVETSDGDVGVVVSQSDQESLRPRLMLVLDAGLAPYLPARMLNLSSFTADQLSIIRALDPTDPRISKQLDEVLRNCEQHS